MERIGPYEILEELGQGGMGVVYRARQASLNRMIALKVLPSHLESDDTAVRRFRQEGETAARLKHDNIVTVYDAHVDEPPYYIAMEFLQGRPLDSIIAERGRLEPEEAVAIISQVCAGLDHAHENGIIHRDIKPANIMIDESGKATITDFGIARATDQTRLTATGAVFGSPDYMSPEQAKGLPIDHRTDLYSAGAVLYEMLTGRAPFAGGTALTVMNRITTEPPPSPRGFYRGISPALEAVVLKALEKDPLNRYLSGAEMVRALQAAMREPETSTLPYETVRVADRRRPLLLGAGLIAVVVLIGVVVFAAFRRNPEGGQTSIAVAGSNGVESGTGKEGGDGSKSGNGGGGSGTDTVTTPNLIGDSVREAKLKVQAVGLEWPQTYDEEEYSESVASGKVLEQTPAPGAEITPDQLVRITLSRGPKPPPSVDVEVPDVNNMPASTAKDAIKNARLSWKVKGEWSTGVRAGYVISTVPSGWVEPGTTITLTISKGPQPKCQYCGKKFNSKEDVRAHQSRTLYACSRYPDCPFTADTPQEVIQHYLSQPEGQVVEGPFGIPITRGAGPCRSDAKVPFSNKWRVKVIPPPTCENIKHPDTWGMDKK